VSYKNNKKSELMLMRRARAYSSSSSQIVLVYLHSFCRSSLFCSQKSQKITKSPYFGIPGHFRSSMLIPLEARHHVTIWGVYTIQHSSN